MLGSNAIFDFLTLDSRIYGLANSRLLEKVARSVQKSIHEISYDILSKEAEKLARMVKEEINAQPPAWPPLNEDYRKWKDKMGLYTDMLKATGAYYDAIAVQETRNNMGQFAGGKTIRDTTAFTIRVGVPYKNHPGLDDDSEKEGALKYIELAEILEYGTDKIPARPHWMPTYRRWKSQHARTIRARIMSIAVRRFQKVFKQSIVTKNKARKIKPHDKA